MFREWMKYGASEVVNNLRVVSYIRNGMTPVGAIIGDCSDCPSIPEALEVPTGAYRTPALDGAPWVSPRDADTLDFLGVHVVEVTGLEGSTTVATIEEKLGDGGVLGTRRAESRTISVTADVVGRTPEGASAGLEWLEAVLHPPCAEGTDCTGDTLSLFSTCPQTCEGTIDPDSPWEASPIDAGEFRAPEPHPLGYIVIGPEIGPICGLVGIGFTMSSLLGAPGTGFGSGPFGSGPFGGSGGGTGSAYQIGVVDAGGTVIEVHPAAYDPLLNNWWVFLSQVPAGSFIAIIAADPADLIVVEGFVTHNHVYTAEECIAPYRRRFANVVTASGPKVVGWRTLGDSITGSSVVRVEWTWVAMEPFAWHPDTPLILGAWSTLNTIEYQAPGVQISNSTVLSPGTTTCTRPPVSVVSCADDPSCPPALLPPQAPVLADPCLVDLATNVYRRRYFEVPADLAPTGLGVLSWTFENDSSEKRGVRVRIWEDTNPAFAPEVECDFLTEFTIEYLGPEHVLSIDGTSGEVTVLCGEDGYGNPVYADGMKNLRGTYRGPFDPSYLVGCGRPLVIAVDVPGGNLIWSVRLTRRA